MSNSNRHEDFHAGRFLQACLQASGHDREWLATQTGREAAEITSLLALPNMDAELFVRLGRPMGTAFFSRVHEEIFGAEKSTCCHG